MVADDPAEVVVVEAASSRDWRRFVGVSRPSSLLGPRPLSAPAVELLPPGEWLRRCAAAPAAARGSSKKDTVGLTSRPVRLVALADVIASDIIYSQHAPRYFRFCSFNCRETACLIRSLMVALLMHLKHG